MRWSWIGPAAALLAVGLLGLACSDDEGTGLDDVIEIRMTSNFQFVPATVVVSPGTTVRWVNDSDDLHTVTPEDPAQAGVWAEATFTARGQFFEHTFNEAGEVYQYFCEPHVDIGMTGSIRVEVE